MKEKCVGFVIRVVINCVVGGEKETKRAKLPSAGSGEVNVTLLHIG